MAGMNHYINTAAVEPSRARTPTLVTTQPQPFPVLFFGDTRTHQFFFHSNGTIETWSGDAGYTLRVTVGDPAAGPFGGSYTLTCGTTTAALPITSTSDDVQNALNALPTISAAGGVSVLGFFPTFLVYGNAVGAVTAITASAALLSPDSSITVTVLTTGTASIRQQTKIALRRAAVASQQVWTPITSPYAGWSGTLTTNTEGGAALLAEYGEAVGNYVQAETLVNVEVVDGSGNIVAYYQQAVLFRAKNTDLSAAALAAPAQSVLANATSGLLVSPSNFFTNSTNVSAISAILGLNLGGTVTLTSGAGTITNASLTTSMVVCLSLLTSSGTPGIYAPLTTLHAGSVTVAGLATDNSTYRWQAFKVTT
jgi:hypothetical protein